MLRIKGSAKGTTGGEWKEGKRDTREYEKIVAGTYTIIYPVLCMYIYMYRYSWGYRV